MISLTVGLFTQVSDSGLHGPLVTIGIVFCIFTCYWYQNIKLCLSFAFVCPWEYSQGGIILPTSVCLSIHLSVTLLVIRLCNQFLPQFLN